MALVPINIKPSGSTITKTKKHNMEIHKLITCGNTSGGSRAVAKENDLGNGKWG
jgi:hypothetical protein